MKKILLSVLSIASLAFVAHAVTYMNVMTDDGKVVKYDVEHVTEVFYTEETVSPTDQGVTVSGKEGIYTYVDLGLESGTKWATYNVGATKPTESGDYFAWGETEPKNNFMWSNYKWCTVDAVGWHDSYTKYNTNSEYGTVDNKTVLEAEDDAASANWGSAWRMPTREEQDELREGCDWEWVEDFNGSGENGLLGTSKKNGATIFLPVAGKCHDMILEYDGVYWSSSLSEVYGYYDAYCLIVRDDYFDWGVNFRYYGQSVRAVLNDGKYVVQFYAQDGKLIESQRIEAGQSATEVKTPIVDGYDFVGWDDSSFVNVTRNVKVHAVYVEQLPDLYVDVEKGDSVVFRQNGKTGYFIVEEATTAEVKLNVFFGGKSNVVTLSDSYGSFCSTGLQMVNSSSAVDNPSQIVFAKASKLARIQSPTSSANATVSSSAPETRFESHNKNRLQLFMVNNEFAADGSILKLRGSGFFGNQIYVGFDAVAGDTIWQRIPSFDEANEKGLRNGGVVDEDLSSN